MMMQGDAEVVPECPRCGCQGSLERRRRLLRGGIQSVSLECDACGRWYTIHEPDPDAVGAEEGAAVVYVTETQRTKGGAECPTCGMFPARVVGGPREGSGKLRVRYHECRGCGGRFTSEEVVA